MRKASRQHELLVRAGTIPPTPRAEAEEKVADAEDGGARAEESEEPPGVSDDAVEESPRALLGRRPGVRSGAVALGEAEDRYGRVSLRGRGKEEQRYNRFLNGA